MKKFRGIAIGLFVATATLLSFGITADASAQSAMQRGIESARATGVPSELFGNAGIITSITNTLLFIVGALAVIMVIFGGIRYAASAGNASAVTAAKNTILYAIIGLIIAFLAFAAINWVLGAISPGGAAGFTDV